MFQPRARLAWQWTEPFLDPGINVEVNVLSCKVVTLAYINPGLV